MFFSPFVSTFIKMRRISCCWKLCLDRILLIWTELRTSALCVDCAQSVQSDTLKWNDFLFFVFIFVVLVPFSCRLFLPTILQMVQVHSSLCTYSILYRLHPLSICLLFFFQFVMFTCSMYTHGFWSVYVIILKQIYHCSSEDWQHRIHSLVRRVCCCCLFTLVPGGPEPDGWVVSEP